MGLSKYCNNSKTIEMLERDPNFKRFANSIVATLDFLNERYNIVLSYDYFSHPITKHNNEIHFKIIKDDIVVMWVYFMYSRSRVNSQYISVEVDNKYIKDIKNNLTGFFEVRERQTHPDVKFKYRDFELISFSLNRICDAIDNVLFGTSHAYIDDINSPLAPKRVVRQTDGTIRYVCGNCEALFSKSPRCPECGQLIKYEEDKSKILRIGDDVSGLKIFEIINKYFGEHYKGWMKSVYDINSDYWAWFPTITRENVRPDGSYGGTANWSNTLSDDEKTLISMDHDSAIDDLPEEERKNPIKKRKILIFGRINGSFKFLGVFNDRLMLDSPVCAYRHDRIAEGIDLSTFELIYEDDE